jgi:hypothetical protein
VPLSTAGGAVAGAGSPGLSPLHARRTSRAAMTIGFLIPRFYHAKTKKGAPKRAFPEIT